MKKGKSKKAKKTKLKLIEGNPNAPSKRKVKINNNDEPLLIKAAVMGSKYADTAPVNQKPEDKINAAIEEYRKIIINDPNDLTVINTLGDLCVRAGRTQEAINCFSEIASKYIELGDTIKALAVYKK